MNIFGMLKSLIFKRVIDQARLPFEKLPAQIPSLLQGELLKKLLKVE